MKTLFKLAVCLSLAPFVVIGALCGWVQFGFGVGIDCGDDLLNLVFRKKGGSK